MSVQALNEDDLIKKRLLIEGDSGNEDRLINKLIRTFIKWCNSEANVEQVSNNSTTGTVTISDEENAEQLYEQMIANLSQIEFGLLRNHFVLEMNNSEQVLLKIIN
jgi:THO complex subunit 7